jgi:hypothetical protein
MILLGYNWLDVVITTMYVSIIILVLVIAYRKLIRFLNKDAIMKERYCVLYPLDNELVADEVTFYFTSEKKRNFKLVLLDQDMTEIKEIANKECTPGGNIIRYNSKLTDNGNYFYCLITENQKTMKKMTIKND